MAPQTNIGSSTPISDRRREHPAATCGARWSTTRPRRCARSRRATAATSPGPTQAVREGVEPAPPSEALQAERDRPRSRRPCPALLDADRRLQDRCRRAIVLHTTGAEVDDREACASGSASSTTLIDPNLIALMLSLGVLGIVIEIWHPGLIFPATFGALCLALALLRPRRAADQLGRRSSCSCAALAFWIAELFIAFSHGALDGRGRWSRSCFGSPAALRRRPGRTLLRSRCSVALAIAGTFGCFCAFVLAKVVQMRRRPVERRHAGRSSASTGVVRDGRPRLRERRALAGAHRGRRAARAGRRGATSIAVDGLALVVRAAREPDGVVGSQS